MNESEKDKVLDLYPEFSKIFGPYHRRSDDRKMVVLTGAEGVRTTRQLAKVLLEIKLGRRLVGKETVDHRDGDKQNDLFTNLQLKTRSENSSESARRLVSQTFTCKECSENFHLDGVRLGKVFYNLTRGASGPFCGRRCAGRYNAKVGHGQRDRGNDVLVKREYRTLKTT